MKISIGDRMTWQVAAQPDQLTVGRTQAGKALISANLSRILSELPTIRELLLGRSLRVKCQSPFSGRVGVL
jgi:hypothetical protein